MVDREGEDVKMQMCYKSNLGALMNVNIYCGSSASLRFTSSHKTTKILSEKSVQLKWSKKSRFVYLLFTVCVLSFHYFLSTFILCCHMITCMCSRWLCLCRVEIMSHCQCELTHITNTSPSRTIQEQWFTHRRCRPLAQLHNRFIHTTAWISLLSHYTRRRRRRRDERAEKQVQLFSSESHRQWSTSKVDLSRRRCKCEVVGKLFFSSSLY